MISGFDKREIETSDTGKILAALGDAPTDETIARVSPWRYAAPLAPSMAARAEGKTLDCEALFSFSNKVLHEEVDLALIEGVGGVMVPLDDEKTVLDWIVASGAPVVLVVGDYLGAISHTLTAVEVLRMKGIEIAAVVVSAGDGGPAFRRHDRRNSPMGRANEGSGARARRGRRGPFGRIDRRVARLRARQIRFLKRRTGTAAAAAVPVQTGARRRGYLSVLT